jgi:pyrimidine-nucleoside phosphorylase
VRELKAPKSGYIASIDAFKIGLAGVYIGVGRNKTTDAVFPDVGFIFEKVKGDKVNAGDVVAKVYARTEEAMDSAWALVEAALTLAQDKPAKTPLVLKEITAL